MNTAQDILDRAEKALVDALAMQEREGAIAQGIHDRDEAASTERFTNLKAGYDEKHAKAHTYLDGEVALIAEIEAALQVAGAVKTEKVMMLAEMSQRLTNHVGQRLTDKYVTSINRGDLKRKIEDMLAAVDASLDLEAASSKAQKKADLAEAKAFQESTETSSAGVLATKEAELQAGVDAAAAAKATALAELNVAQAEEAEANKQSLEAQAAHKAELAQEKRETAEAKRARAEQEAAQDMTKAQNTKLANSKQAQGLKYLAQERATVDSIEKLLANLGKGYKFTVPTGATGFMQLAATEAKGQQKMSAEQRAALQQLLSMVSHAPSLPVLATTAEVKADASSGTDEQVWKHGDNKFGGSDHSDGQKVIADVLNQVRDAIKASEDEVNANNKADLATVQSEFDAARAATKGRFDKEIQRMADEVEAARKLKVAKMAHHDHTVNVMNGKQRVFDDKAQDLVERQEQQRVEGQFARDTHDANVQAADTYLVQRNAQINSEADDDARYIREERDAIQEVRDALSTINFASLLEASAKYDAEQTTYMATDSFDMKTKMIALLDGISTNVNSELKRASREFKDDMDNNKDEHTRADDEADAFRQADLDHLAAMRLAAQNEFDASDKHLTATTKAHSIASDKHQEDRDDLATAERIEDTNDPMLRAEFARSTASADHVFAEEMEILDNKKSRGDFYLKTNEDGLQSVKKMLTHLDVTTTDTVDAPNTANYAARAEYDTKLADEKFAARTAAESARVAVASDAAAVKSSQSAGIHAGDTITTDSNGGRIATKASAASGGQDVRAKYDSRGRLVTSLLQLGARSMKGEEKVGSFIGALVGSTKAEEAKSAQEYATEAGTIKGTRNDLVAQAKNEMERVLAIDDARTLEAQTAHDASLEVLEAALADKDAASARHAAAARELNDAIKTQERVTPEVEAQHKEALAYNKQTHEMADKDVASKKSEADTYLNNELDMVAKVKAMVEEKLGKTYGMLVEMVSHLVRSHATKMGSRTHYEYKIRESKRFEDKQADAGKDYMEDGTIAKNDYGSKVGTIDEMLDANADRITKEITDVAGRHTADMAFLTKEHLDAKNAAQAVYDKKRAELTLFRKLAREAYADAFAARAVQENIRNLADQEQAKMKGIWNEAKKLQANNRTLEEDIKSRADADTERHFKTWMAHYAAEKARATAIIARERKILGEIRNILSGDKLNKGAEASVAVDTCQAEEDAKAAATKAAAAARDACADARIAAAGGKKADVAGACDASAAAEAAVEGAEAAEATCMNGKAGLALLEVNRLGAKYIKDFSAADKVEEGLAVVTQLEDTLTEEQAKVAAGFTQDVADEKQLRADRLAKAARRLARTIAFHKAACALAKKNFDAAWANYQKELAEWKRLLAIQKAKFALKVAAEERWVREEKIAMDIMVEEKRRALQRFTTEKGKVDDIKRKDTEYLRKEFTAIKQLKAFVKELNSKGL